MKRPRTVWAGTSIALEPDRRRRAGRVRGGIEAELIAGRVCSATAKCSRKAMRSRGKFLAGLLLLLAPVIALARSNESPLSPQALRPYIHEGLWETSLTIERAGAGAETGKTTPDRECLTAAKAESVVKQCRDGEDCRRQCRSTVDVTGAHAARIRLNCSTPQGETTGDFDFGWDTFEGRIRLVRDGKTLMAIRISAHRIGDCQTGR